LPRETGFRRSLATPAEPWTTVTAFSFFLKVATTNGKINPFQTGVGLLAKS
jgi:hypothetical protein